MVFPNPNQADADGLLAYGGDLRPQRLLEACADGALVGGLYGVSLGAAFFGESMFTRRPDASKVAFVHLVQHLQSWHFHFVDCQMYTDHLARFGAVLWRRERFLQALAKALQEPTHRGQWTWSHRAE